GRLEAIEVLLPKRDLRPALAEPADQRQVGDEPPPEIPYLVTIDGAGDGPHMRAGSQRIPVGTHRVQCINDHCAGVETALQPQNDLGAQRSTVISGHFVEALLESSGHPHIENCLAWPRLLSVRHLTSFHNNTHHAASKQLARYVKIEVHICVDESTSVGGQRAEHQCGCAAHDDCRTGRASARDWAKSSL